MGSELPLVAVGGSDPSNQSPYAFGSAQPYINFAWSVNQAHLAALKNPFSANQVTDTSNNMQLKSKNVSYSTVFCCGSFNHVTLVKSMLFTGSVRRTMDMLAQ